MKHDDRKLEQDQAVAGLSRRDWLLNFGSAVILSGFAGMPGESQQTEHALATALPPGLYTPSMDQATHALNHDGPFLPQAFSSEEFMVIRRLVELILGEDQKTATAQPAGGRRRSPMTKSQSGSTWSCSAGQASALLHGT